jgi:hypothetical protein
MAPTILVSIPARHGGYNPPDSTRQEKKNDTKTHADHHEIGKRQAQPKRTCHHSGPGHCFHGAIVWRAATLGQSDKNLIEVFLAGGAVFGGAPVKCFYNG